MSSMSNAQECLLVDLCLLGFEPRTFHLVVKKTYFYVFQSTVNQVDPYVDTLTHTLL